MIGSSLLEPSWLEGIPGDLPAMIVAEGVMMYLPASGRRPAFGEIGRAFSKRPDDFRRIEHGRSPNGRADKA